MIEFLESRIAPATFIVTTSADSGPGSLRQAIIDANADTTADVINFNIPGTSVRTIFLQSALPQIAQPVTINAYSQPGSSVNTLTVGTDAVIRIEIDGSSLSSRDGLTVNNASNVTIRGLAIFGFEDEDSLNGNGIKIIGNSSNVTVAGCFLGTDATGLGGAPNQNDGVDLGTGVSNITIGGSAAADRNLISNNSGDGIQVRGTNISIRGNLIGTGPDGSTAVPNGQGITLGFIAGATIGGPGSEQNVIANNNREGIQFFSTSSAVNILPNSFFRNVGLAIDFGGVGVTPNDPLDADTGQNGLQNFPVITGVDPENSIASFALDSSANGTFRIDFYASTSPDPSGFGEGKTFLTSVFVFTDGTGRVAGSIPLLSPIANGTTITATATNLNTLETSEFSRGFNINNVAFPNDKTATWLDSDGDRVTLKITKGTLTAANFFFSSGVLEGGQILQLLQLTAEEFNGTNISVSVKKVAGGDGRVEVGFIDANDRDLGSVTIPGDLGRIVCGDVDTTTLSLKNLKVESFGVAGTQTLPDGVNQSEVTGAAGSILVASDFRDVTFRLSPLDGSAEERARVRIETFKIGGNLSSDRPTSGSQINLNGSVKTLTVAGSLIGGGNGSGNIAVFDGVGKVTLGHVYNAGLSLGGSGAEQDIPGKLTIKGDLVGGSVFTGLSVKQITVLGSVIGTPGGGGSISSSGDLTKVVVAGDLVGGRASFGQFISNTGVIEASGSIGQVLIAGSVIGGTVSSDGSNLRSGAIRAGNVLGSVVIGGDTIGSANSPVIISGEGSETKPTEGLDVAIRSVVIKGNAIDTLILGGFRASGATSNADASIGSVKVGRNWVGSSIVAGAQDAGLPGFGAGDVLQTAGDTALVAKIASISIRGSFLPGITPLMNFGFVAQEIGKVQIGGSKVLLTAGPSNDNQVIGAFPNLHILEV